MFCRYSVHGDIPYRQGLQIWHGEKQYPLFILLYPLGYGLALIDRIRGKVEKTHLLFEQSIGAVNYRCVRYHCGEAESLPLASMDR